MEKFSLERHDDGSESIRIPYRGRDLLAHNMYNRGTAFTQEERRAFELDGLLPAHVSNLEEQSRRTYASITRKTEPLERFIGLEALEARDAVLYYRLLCDHIEEFLPVVYTPTVGEACQRYSHIFRRGRGLWITPDDRERIDQVLANAPFEDVRLIVVTDNERILGLGDLGAGGIGIPVGKLALYTVGAGFHPTQCLPISLDVGTNNPELLSDPLYIGWRHKRLRGQAYDDFIEAFVQAVQRRFPRAVLQWEDFKKNTAFALLDRYRERICSFNDDIQGTAAVAVAGIMAAARATDTTLADQRIVMLGAGAAGVGIARLWRDALRRQGLSGEALVRSIAVLDSNGLLVQGRKIDDEHKHEFAWPVDLVRSVGLDPNGNCDLLACVKALKPTVLMGTSGQPGVFDEAVIRAVAAGVARPVVFPFSNPNSQCEAQPDDVVQWSDGRAIVATGSPFAPVDYKGRRYLIGQGNNAYIFPGVGLGASVVEAKRITDVMFLDAAYALARMVETSDLREGALYPPLSQLRSVSAEIAVAVALAAIKDGVAAPVEELELRARVKRAMWEPSYPKIKR